MATMNMEVQLQTYGTSAARTMMKLAVFFGASEEVAVKVGLALMFVRVKSGGKVSWHWLLRCQEGGCNA
jgi:hypothetical protein